MGNNLLKGKRGIIFGALNDQSIAWKVAERAHEEGAEFVLTNAPIAMRMGEINNLAEKTGSKIIPADATSVEDLEKLITESMEILGGKIDFILHSIGMSVNVRKGNHYTEENYDRLVAPENVIVTNGAKQSLFNIFFSILNPQDEVVWEGQAAAGEQQVEIQELPMEVGIWTLVVDLENVTGGYTYEWIKQD